MTDKKNKQDAILMIKQGSQELHNAYKLLIELNPMAADVDSVKRLMLVSKDCGAIMQEISKLRGLE